MIKEGVGIKLLEVIIVYVCGLIVVVGTGVLSILTLLRFKLIDKEQCKELVKHNLKHDPIWYSVVFLVICFIEEVVR